MSATASSTSLDKKELTEGSSGARVQTVGGSEVDVAAHIVAGKNISFTPEEALRVRCVAVFLLAVTAAHNSARRLTAILRDARRKIDMHLMPLMCSEYRRRRFLQLSIPAMNGALISALAPALLFDSTLHVRRINVAGHCHGRC